MSDERLKTTSPNPKTIQGLQKPPVDQVPPAGILHESLAMADGSGKYGFRNWRMSPVEARIYVAAAMRHLFAFLDGEFWDPDSKNGASHLGAARAGLGILLDAMHEGNWIDDRVPGEGAELIRYFQRTGGLPEPREPVEVIHADATSKEQRLRASQVVPTQRAVDPYETFDRTMVKDDGPGLR